MEVRKRRIVVGEMYVEAETSPDFEESN